MADNVANFFNLPSLYNFIYYNMVHTLILTIPDSNDCRVQKIFDSSIYNDSISISNALLEVTPPGYDCPVVLNTSKNFNILLNSSNLKMIQSNSGVITSNLPDGIYHYKYSVDPNVRMFVEYDVLRTCKIMSKYRDAIRKIFDRRATYTFDIFKQKLESLLYISQLIEAAKVMILDENGNNKNAIELYNEANVLLKDYNNCDVC